ncbi:spore gernimation protein [Pseudoflavonifractor sp. 524-17]|uniref:GerAB/ArcD/ProY family transporter n=1 Tax=Pseudoflavonifractor sp. 524-17 TaxID=2304577 RepID=UPI00137B381D|nr:GerAB/ArcD/ProY family transporter [Pseudoflavonifractor sp. 524-17]NCE63761.1 spore gernimation protein [Pseudoflavonifractor sp. 524-17]
MKEDKITLGQLLALLFGALLSPMLLLLPRQTAMAAGKGGWLCSIAAVPAVLAAAWALSVLLRARPEGNGLSAGLEAAFGKGLGRGVTAVYLLWGLLLLGWNTRWCAFRFLSTGYRNGPLNLFIVILLAVTFQVGRRKLSVLARAGEVFALALGAGLGLSLLFAAFHMERANLGPLGAGEAAGIGRGTAPVLGLMGYGVFAAFLGGRVERRPGQRRRLLRWAGLMCAGLTAFQLVCMGNFGPGLIVRMEIPFFMMIKGVGVPGAFERVESLLMALWVLADLCLLGLLFFACRQIGEDWWGGKESRRLPWGIILAGAALALWTMPDAFILSYTMEHVAAAGNVILGGAVPVAAAVILKIRGTEGAGKERGRRKRKKD